MKEISRKIKLPPDRYSVFIKTGRFTVLRLSFFIFYVLISTILIILLALVDDFNSSQMLWLSSFFLILHFFFVVNGIHYLYFRGWRKRLPFKLSCWEVLTGVKKFDKIFWRDNYVIPLIINDSEPNLMRDVNEILSKFANRANKKFYIAEGSPKSGRRKIFLSGNLTARGSANAEIIGLLKRLCTNELTKIAKKSGKLTRVKLSIDSEVYSVMPYIPTGPDAS